MTNPYYNHTSGVPAADTKGLSSALRSEFDGIAGGFDSVDAALDAVFAGGGLASTSVTSLTIGTGSKSLTVAASLSFAAGQYVVIASTAAPTVDYMEGRITSYNSTTGALVVSASISAGSGTYASWTVALQAGLPNQSGNSGKFLTTDGTNASWASVGSVTLRSVSGADTVVAGDKGDLIDCSGTFSLAITAAATLGDGFYFYVKNSGTGVITIDPNSSETIDGLTSFTMYPGEVRLIQCDGTALRSIVLTGFRYKFTTTTSITVPPGYTAFGHKIVSGSGGGGSGPRRASGTSSWGGTGGGGAGVHVGTTTGATAGGTLTITVGAGGTGGAAVTADNTNGADGTNGGASGLVGAGFNTTVSTTSTKGRGGVTSAPSGAFGGGVAIGGAGGFFGGQQPTYAEFGGGGSGAGSASLGVNNPGWSTVWGGASGGGGGGYNSSTPQAASSAGTSTYGAAGGAGGAVATNGSAGTAAGEWGGGGGGGGGASQNGTDSGAGGNGVAGFVELWGIL